jgi:hypothetical protein
MTSSQTLRPLRLAFLLACAASCSSRTAQVEVDGGATAGYTKIDDMEGDGGSVEWPPPSGLTPGFWFTATDCSEAGNIWPPPATVTAGVLTPSIWSYSPLPASHETFPGIVSTRAARLRTTSPLSNVWGANMGFELASMPGLTIEIPPTGKSDAGVSGSDASTDNPAGCPIILGDEASVDLSAYSGITFWAMGDPAGARTIQVMFSDAHTDPRGGICNYVDINSPDYCYNDFAITIGLTDTFARYTVDFASLTQSANWGYHPNPDVFDVQHVYDLAFQVTAPVCYPNEMCVGGAPPPVTFDFWIDDLYFVNKVVGGE